MSTPSANGMSPIPRHAPHRSPTRMTRARSSARTRRAVSAALLVLASLSAAACTLLRPPPVVRYYTLAPPGTPPAGLDAPIRVGAFSADEPYVTARLAYRTSPYRLDYYAYHRWAADPRVLLATAARDYLEHAAASSGMPFELSGHIRRLEEVDGQDGWEAALALDIRVRRDGKLLLERSYAETERAARRNPEAVAAALSAALGRILDQVVTELAASGGVTAGTREPGTREPGAREPGAREPGAREQARQTPGRVF